MKRTYETVDGEIVTIDDKKPRKYQERKTEIDGITFDSAAEARRYVQLKMFEAAGEIKDIEIQPKFVLQPAFKHGDQKVQAITYRADFRYTEVATDEQVVEDVKGMETEVFRLKAKMLLYQHHIEVKRVRMSAARKR